jgi:hypothetical protein
MYQHHLPSMGKKKKEKEKENLSRPVWYVQKSIPVQHWLKPVVAQSPRYTII